MTTMMTLTHPSASWLGPKVSSRNTSFDSSDDDLLTCKLDDLMKPSNSKLAPLAKKQQKTLYKQEYLLVERWKRIQPWLINIRFYNQSLNNFPLITRQFHKRNFWIPQNEARTQKVESVSWWFDDWEWPFHPSVNQCSSRRIFSSLLKMHWT